MEALRTLLEAVTKVASDERDNAGGQVARGPEAWEAAAKEAARGMAARESASRAAPRWHE